MASQLTACPSEDTCWVCGQSPTIKNRRVLNSPLNKCILVGLQELGVPEDQLPPTLQEGSVIQRVYICKGCFSKVEKFMKLQADIVLCCEDWPAKMTFLAVSIYVCNYICTTRYNTAGYKSLTSSLI